MFCLDTAKEFVFHQLPTSVYLSRRFAKKVLLIGISHICRERLKFSKDEFILRTAGDTKVLVRQKSTTIFDNFFYKLNLQALNPYEEGENEQTNYVKNHIRQIFQLAENGWLDKVILAIGREVSSIKYSKSSLQFLDTCNKESTGNLRFQFAREESLPQD